jgi:predicted hydrolase (HD superfamily)
MPTRDEAWQLVCEWTESDSLRKHMLAVEAAVRAYARRLEADEETWAVAALVHDLDYERYPDLETGHPRYAV